jgi:type II secretory pathway pseudopilin PulG
VDAEITAIASAEDAAARVALQAARAAARRSICDWAADLMTTYKDWQDYTTEEKDGFQGHHPNRKADMLKEVTGNPYRIFKDFIVPILGDNTKGTPHYDASRGQEVAKALGYGMTAAGAYALHQAGCSAEAILKITTVFLNNVKENQWNLNDDQPKGPE